MPLDSCTQQVDRNVEREICNHRLLNHPNIVGFKEVRTGGAHTCIATRWWLACCAMESPGMRFCSHMNCLQVFLTPSHLGIVMEFAAGGELFERIVKAGRFSEDEARYFFQQLISGVDYCHTSVSPGLGRCWWCWCWDLVFTDTQ